ncbi:MULTISPECIES: hypothetical protein [unclassified Massilia]|uniref:DUF7677 family protein n=1 Tax=unclassified Massilia TaxID=2609279 RepID=UPI0009EBF229|nr:MULTISPECIES: hypothetical protein [unclassified Massilia]
MGFFDKTKQPDGSSSYPRKLSPDFAGALRTFSFWIANGTVGHPLLEGIDYRREMLASPSLMEQAYAIFANVIELSGDGMPTNAKYAEYRAAQYIRSYCDPTYTVSPPFEGWEVELLAPPPREDSKPWPSGL